MVDSSSVTHKFFRTNLSLNTWRDTIHHFDANEKDDKFGRNNLGFNKKVNNMFLFMNT